MKERAGFAEPRLRPLQTEPALGHKPRHRVTHKRPLTADEKGAPAAPAQRQRIGKELEEEQRPQDGRQVEPAFTAAQAKDAQKALQDFKDKLQQ